MAIIERFEDIQAWKTCRILAREIYHETSRAPLSRDFGFRDQIRRAVVSGMSNIAEGFERGGNSDFSSVTRRGVSLSTADMTAMEESPWKGRSPVSIS